MSVSQTQSRRNFKSVIKKIKSYFFKDHPLQACFKSVFCSFFSHILIFVSPDVCKFCCRRRCALENVNSSTSKRALICAICCRSYNISSYRANESITTHTCWLSWPCFWSHTNATVKDGGFAGWSVRLSIRFGWRKIDCCVTVICKHFCPSQSHYLLPLPTRKGLRPLFSLVWMCACIV